MQCPRCQSERIQRDYDDSIIFLRAVGMHKLLCNNCGLVFKGFDPQGKLQRAPTAQKPKEGVQMRNRRRGPRFSVHLPAAISLIEGGAQPGIVSYSPPSRGHCEAISEFGMLLSLVGTRFGEGELSRPGRLLFVRIDLPEAPIDVVVAIVTNERTGEGQKRKWLLGVKVHQIADADAELLKAYIEKRGTDPA
ncbi:MAG TPA: PilZ domain-containing protein [Pyrinomonadaceae bacterium]|jgi:hypothetical protein